MAKRAKAAKKRPPNPTPMPIFAPVEIPLSSWLEVEFDEVVLVATVMLMAFSEKISPEIVRSWPTAGSCSQPASRAKRTGKTFVSYRAQMGSFL